MLKKSSREFIAFFQATGVVVYLGLLALFFAFVVPSLSVTAPFYVSIAMLLLFIISAVVTSSLVLGRSAILFWNKKYRESILLLGWTIIWSIIYFILLIAILIWLEQ
jgi:hypothetical protein